MLPPIKAVKGSLTVTLASQVNLFAGVSYIGAKERHEIDSHKV